MNETPQKIGFIGFGVMGSAMASHLARHGHTVYGFSRSLDKVRAAASSGVTVRSSLGELARDIEVAILSVTDGAAVEQVLFGADGLIASLPRGALIVDTTTISPSEAEEFGRRCADAGIAFVDSPVTGGDVGARDGTLTAMVGAEPEDFQRARRLLSCFARTVLHMGPVGAGQKTKAVNQIAVALSIIAMTEALSFAEAHGLNLASTLQVLQGGAAGSWALTNYAPRVLKNDLAPGFAAAHMLKDLRIAQSEVLAKRPLPALQHALPLFEQLNELGAHQLGNHALIEVYRRFEGEHSTEK